MEKLVFRPLKETEIDVRVQSVTEKGCILLLYKDARCDMNILDETVGPMNWKREHTRDNANCIVSLWDEQKEQWVSKEDTGTESNTEKEKGQASDSFKRACFNWGIGRELYTSPFIWVKKDDCNMYSIKGNNGKDIWKCNDKFEVEKIAYDENKNINGLAIKNINKKKIVFTLGGNKYTEVPTEAPKEVEQPKSNVCSECSKAVTENVVKFSNMKFKKILCLDCQKKFK